MEEQVKVNVVEDNTPPATTQEKEAAVLEQAIEEGSVDESYGLQDDGVYKVNLDKPPTPKEDAIQEQETESVSVGDGAEDSPEVDEQVREQDTKEENEEEEVIDDSPLQLVNDEPQEEEKQEVQKEIQQETKQELKQEEPKVVLPENVEKLVQFMEETGGTVEDYVNLNRDISKMDNTTLLREYYKNTKPHLDADDVDFLFNKNFAYDEETDDPSEVKAKQLAFKEELYNAQNYFNSSREKYYADLKLRKQESVAPEYAEAMEYYNNSKQQSEEYNNLQKEFIEKTNKVFNDNFKGFDFKVGENKYRFKVDNTEKVKQYQSDISNFINEFLGDDGSVADAAGYHRALFAAKNADKIANHFYEQGRADAVKEAAKQAKNINMDPRSDNSTIKTEYGDKIRVVSGNSSDKLRIKWNK
jgi:hypothetical protein